MYIFGFIAKLLIDYFLLYIYTLDFVLQTKKKLSKLRALYQVGMLCHLEKLCFA